MRRPTKAQVLGPFCLHHLASVPIQSLFRTMIEPSLEMMAGALFELIALARVHEYTSVPGLEIGGVTAKYVQK